MGELFLDNLTIGYGEQAVVRDFTLGVSDGEMVSLLGPSGAGKTTVLKAVTGLIRPRRGRILIDGKPVHRLPPEKRDAVMVFQKALLFPYMNVSQNVGFGLRMLGQPTALQKRKIAHILKLVRLEGLEKRRVHELSGGQQQRVSLARALVLEPAVLLLDEPLSNLDASLRQRMRELIQDIQAATGITMLFVTHDQAEALMISHRVCLLLHGRLRQVGSPRDLFHRPADPEVARFFGGDNFFQGRMNNGLFETVFGRFAVPGLNVNGHELTATIRPEDIEVSSEKADGLRGTVYKTAFEGVSTRLWVQCRETRFVVLTSDARIESGQRIGLRLPPDKIRVFPLPSSIKPPDK